MVSINERLSRAEQFLDERNTDKPIDIYNDIIKENPNNVFAFIGLGKSYLEKEMWEESIYYFLRAEVINPLPDVYYNMGILFNKKKNFMKSLEYFDKALEKGFSEYDINYNKALVYEKLKDKKNAVKHYIKAYTVNAKLALCYKIAPLALEALMYKDAIRFYKIIVELDKKPLYFAELGLAYLSLGMYKESKDSYKEAKNLSQLAVKYSNIDKVTFEDFMNNYSKNSEKSIKEIKEKIKINKDDFNDHFNLGNIFFANKDYKKSLEAFKSARDKYKLLLNNRKNKN